jgi:hypothetical protein
LLLAADQQGSVQLLLTTLQQEALEAGCQVRPA